MMLSDLLHWVFTDPSNGQVAAYRIMVFAIFCITLVALYAIKQDLGFLKKKVDKVDQQTNGNGK